MHHEPCVQLYSLPLLKYGPKAICIRKTFPLFQGRKRKKGLFKFSVPPEVCLWNKINKASNVFNSSLVQQPNESLSCLLPVEWLNRDLHLLLLHTHFFIWEITQHSPASYVTGSTMNTPVQCHLRLTWASGRPMISLQSCIFFPPKRLDALVHPWSWHGEMCWTSPSLLSLTVLLFPWIAIWAASTPFPVTEHRTGSDARAEGLSEMTPLYPGPDRRRNNSIYAIHASDLPWPLYPLEITHQRDDGELITLIR